MTAFPVAEELYLARGMSHTRLHRTAGGGEVMRLTGALGALAMAIAASALVLGCGGEERLVSGALGLRTPSRRTFWMRLRCANSISTFFRSAVAS